MRPRNCAAMPVVLEAAGVNGDTQKDGPWDVDYVLGYAPGKQVVRVSR